MNRLGIIPKLTLIFVLFAALLLVVVSVLAFTSGRDALQTAAVSELLSAAIDKQAALDAWIGEAQVHTTAIASSPYVQGRLVDFQEAQRRGDAVEARAAHDRLVAELQIWAGEGKDYLGWMVLDPQSGQVIAATDASEEGKYRDDQAYFINGKSGPYLQNVYYSLAAQGTLLTGSTPIRAADGGVLGVLAGNLDLGKMNEIVSRRTGLRQSDDTFLVNTSELFVTQPRFISDPAVLRLGVHTEAVKLCLARNSGVITADDYRGVLAMTVYRWLPERQMCLIVKMDRAEALAPALALGKNVILISSFALLAAAALAWWLSRTIARPVRQLVQGAEQIGQGHLDTRLEVKSGDEIGKLGIAFNKMAASIGEKDTQLRKWATDLEQRVEERTTELRESEDRYRTLSETSPDMIFVIDRHDKVQYVNNLASRQFGKTPEQVIGKARTELFPPGIAENQALGLQKVLKSGELFSSESSIAFPGGQLWLDTQLVPLRNEAGEINAVMGVSRDITERKQAEEEIRKLNADLEHRVVQRTAQLEAANKELEAFSYSISHDLRAPLRAMDGFSRILLEENAAQLPAQAQRYLGLVRDSAQQMGHLIEDLLAFSRLSRLPLNKQTVAPAEVVQKALAELGVGQEQRNVEITVGDLPACEADPALLKQVWVNLLANALKFTRSREAARIEVGFLPHSTPPGAAPGVGMDEVGTYFVRDNGVGFDMQYAHKLFGVFQRLHRIEEYEGTGVGLAIVQRIVNRHGGRVWAEAEVDKGATFYFTI